MLVTAPPLRRTFAFLAVLTVGLVALPAAGGPRDPRQERREDRRDGRQDRREDRREERRDDRQGRRDDRQDRREDRRDDRQDRREDRRDDRRDDRQDRRGDREARREARRAELRAKWGDALDRPKIQAELRIHGRRSARLDRIASVAEANGKPELAERAKRVAEREDARHDKRMTHLKSEAAQ